ncbi:MAG TPA: hypothetical protein VMT24_04340 [Aggregatilineaceae bacterium]|nr:hypothetical protein [Aggregatilineaceae bacterium]
MVDNEPSLRVSVATLDKVIFQSPRDGTLMMALERKATLTNVTNRSIVDVRAQPFGGAVRLRNLDGLRDLIRDFKFDSERSRSEQDFRILIRPTHWPAIKQFCLQHLQNADDVALESDPCRELVEEFADALQVDLRPDQYVYQPLGFAIENEPVPTDNLYSRGFPTVRIYRIFEVSIVDDALCLAMLTASEHHSDYTLQTLVLNDAKNTGRGRANTVLALSLKRLLDFYLNVLPEKRYVPGYVEGHHLDVSVLAVLKEVEVPQLQRL